MFSQEDLNLVFFLISYDFCTKVAMTKLAPAWVVSKFALSWPTLYHLLPHTAIESRKVLGWQGDDKQSWYILVESELHEMQWNFSLKDLWSGHTLALNIFQSFHRSREISHSKYTPLVEFLVNNKYLAWTSAKNLLNFQVFRRDAISTCSVSLNAESSSVSFNIPLFRFLLSVSWN